MARQPGLAKSEPSITISQRLLGNTVAKTWVQRENPPIEIGKAGVYAAALEASPQLTSPGATGETVALLARCLLYCHAEAQQFVAEYIPWYLIAFSAFTDDPQVVFFLATLCFQGSIQESNTILAVYAALLRTSWLSSPFWATYGLNKKVIIADLAHLYARDRNTLSSDRVTIVSAAFEKADGKDRGNLATYLAAAYRAAERSDTKAMEIYKEAFHAEPDDTANCRYLANLLVEAGTVDELACTVYGRMAVLCETDFSDEGAQWIVQLTHTYIALGRFDTGTFHTLKEANEIAPEDTEIAAALAYVTACHQETMPDSDVLDLLENALRREEEFAEVFARHGWSWKVIIRALSAGWGRTKRADRIARAVYSRAMVLCPEETEHCLHLVHALAKSQNYSLDAIPHYEDALRITPDDDALLIALGRSYMAIGAERGEMRGDAVRVWERLHRQKLGWSEMVRALAAGYLGDERVSDTALSIWAQVIANEPENCELRIRMGRELKGRGDMEGALGWFRKGLAVAPNDFEALFQTGLMLVEYVMDYSGAADLLIRAIATPVGAQHLKAHATLGEALLGLERRAEAQQIFQTIIERIDANHAPSLMHLARLNLRYEKTSMAQAEALIEQALTLTPNDPQAYVRLAELYREKGQAVEEEEALEKYIALAGADPATYRQLADLYIRRGEYTKAEGALRQVISLGAGDKKLYTLLGEVMLSARSRAA